MSPGETVQGLWERMSVTFGSLDVQWHIEFDSEGWIHGVVYYGGSDSRPTHKAGYKIRPSGQSPAALDKIVRALKVEVMA